MTAGGQWKAESDQKGGAVCGRGMGRRQTDKNSVWKCYSQTGYFIY